MVTALVVTFTAYKHDTEKRIQALLPVANHENDAGVVSDEASNRVHDDVEQLRRQLNTDIGQLATRCEGIEHRLGKLEEKFHYDTETTIVAQNLSDSFG